MASTRALLALLLVSTLLPSSLPQRTEDHLDTKGVQFRAVPSRLATGLLPVRVMVPLSVVANSLFNDGDRSIACVLMGMSGRHQPQATFCHSEDAVRQAGRHIVETLLAAGLSRARQPQHHAESWLDAVKYRGQEDAAEDADSARDAALRTEVAAVMEFVQQLEVQVKGSAMNESVEINLEPKGMSPDLTIQLRNLTDSSRRHARERKVLLGTHVQEEVPTLRALRNALGSLRSTVLSPCGQHKMPSLQMARLRQEAERQALARSPDVKLLQPQGYSPSVIFDYMRGVTCTVLANVSAVQLDYSLPVSRAKSAWHLYTAKHVLFLVSGQWCTILPLTHTAIQFATNGTDVHRCMSEDGERMAPLFDDVYLLPRSWPWTDASETCLRALVHSASADEAADACPMFCEGALNHTSVGRLNATSFWVLNTASSVTVQCPGRADVVLPSIYSGRHEVTLPCECLARNGDGEVLIHRGVGCADGNGPPTALAVDSSWTDEGFDAVSLYLTREDEAALPPGRRRLAKPLRTMLKGFNGTLMTDQAAKAALAGGGGGGAQVWLLWVALAAVALAGLAYAVHLEGLDGRGGLQGHGARRLREACGRRLPFAARCCGDKDEMVLREENALHGQDQD